MKTWFVPSASPWEHGQQGWRRHMYEVHAEVKSGCRDNSVGGERWHPQWLLPGPWKMSYSFFHVCRAALGNGWTEPERQPATEAPHAHFIKHQLRPSQTAPALKGFQRNWFQQPPGATAAQLPECDSIRQREGGIYQSGSGEQGRSHSYIWIYLEIHICAISGTKTFDLDLSHLSASLLLKREALLRFFTTVKRNFLQRSPQTRSASDFLQDINTAKALKKFPSPTFTFPVQVVRWVLDVFCSCTLPGGWL